MMEPAGKEDQMVKGVPRPALVSAGEGIGCLVRVEGKIERENEVAVEVESAGRATMWLGLMITSPEKAVVKGEESVAEG